MSVDALMPMPRRNGRWLLAMLLVTGFLYPGVATPRLYRELFRSPRSTGAAAAIDAYLAPLQIASADELRRAVARLNWSGDIDVSLVTDVPPTLSAQDIGQAHFAVSYALYPARVWLRSAADALAARSGKNERRILVIGDTNPFGQAIAHRISGRLWLVELP